MGMGKLGQAGGCGLTPASPPPDLRGQPRALRTITLDVGRECHSSHRGSHILPDLDNLLREAEQQRQKLKAQEGSARGPEPCG